MNLARRQTSQIEDYALAQSDMAEWNSGAEPAERMVLSSFQNGYMHPDIAWRGFSDRVMGGVSNAQLAATQVAGKNCIRLSGNVTRESNGGFIQMAMYFGKGRAQLDARGYKGLELLVYGNNEDYNVHIRTGDCRWYDQSYRMTFFATPQWQRLRIPWDVMQGNSISKPLDPSSLQRIAVVGWMREFEADVSLAELALYS